MNNLIAALQIFAKYCGDECVTHCEHDVLMVNIPIEDVSKEDRASLNKLGFFESEGIFWSYKFGSC